MMILSINERDRISKTLTQEQVDYLQQHVKRGKKTVFANEMAKSKGIVLPENAAAEEIEHLLDGWQLIDYIDNGFVNQKTPCECGRPLRYQYVVKHKESNEIRRFGIVHFEEHTNIPSHIVAEIKKGFASIDFELDELLIKIENNWKMEDEFRNIPDKFVFPNDIQKQLDRELPLLERQIKRVRSAINQFLEQETTHDIPQEHFENNNSFDQMGFQEENLELELFQEEKPEEIVSFKINNMEGYSLNFSHFQAIEQYLEKGITSVRIICEMIIKDQLAPQNRYITGKPRIYLLVCYYLESLVHNGALELIDSSYNDRKYRIIKPNSN